MAPLIRALLAARELSTGSLALYGLYRVLLKSGWLRRRTPIYAWDQRPLAWWLHPGIASPQKDYFQVRARQKRLFFFDPDSDLFRSSLNMFFRDKKPALLEADEILGGRFRLFGADPVELGFPPDWGSFSSVAEGENAPSIDLDLHWVNYEHNRFPADIKLLWEVSRFGWVYPLVRAALLTGETRYSEAIWVLVDSWKKSNPPNSGPHWVSGQEIALRVMALVFVIHSTALVYERDPDRLTSLVQMIAAHADRIPLTLTYSRAQGNNHLLIEAIALYSVGLLFPELRQASRWRELGRRWVLRALAHQIFPDGGYIQHSTNYHRLALQAGLWVTRLAEVNGDSLPQTTLESLRQTTRCLTSLVDKTNGYVPNLGPNDGAHILPLSSCPYKDFRPVTQAASVKFLGHRVYPEGPWDETCVWLGLPADPSWSKDYKITESFLTRKGDQGGKNEEFHDNSAPPAINSREKENGETHFQEGYPDAGLYILRSEHAWGMLRCARFSSRPGHSDQLHFDLWRRGQNIALDPGTYLYNGAPPWDNGLMGARVHNTVVVDDLEPMHRAGRFLWLDWAQGRLLGRWRLPTGELEVLAAEHRGYRRQGIIHRRTIARIGSDLWLVADDLQGEGIHTASIGWLLPDTRWRQEECGLSLKFEEERVKVVFDGPEGVVGIYRAGNLVAGEALRDESLLWGWRSWTYAYKVPALRLVYEVRGSLPLRILTWWSFGGANPESLAIEWRAQDEGPTALLWVEHQGKRLEINHAHSVNPSGFCSAG